MWGSVFFTTEDGKAVMPREIRVSVGGQLPVRTRALGAADGGRRFADELGEAFAAALLVLFGLFVGPALRAGVVVPILRVRRIGAVTALGDAVCQCLCVGIAPRPVDRQAAWDHSSVPVSARNRPQHPP
ncbi:hypothetical protein CG736_06035 [Kitasatospora sp. CB02891]|nr:hypothetical protein CG736_06035 [Kitasatospora sp. CB02891]